MGVAVGFREGRVEALGFWKSGSYFAVELWRGLHVFETPLRTQQRVDIPQDRCSASQTSESISS